MQSWNNIINLKCIDSSTDPTWSATSERECHLWDDYDYGRVAQVHSKEEQHRDIPQQQHWGIWWIYQRAISWDTNRRWPANLCKSSVFPKGQNEFRLCLASPPWTCSLLWRLACKGYIPLGRYTCIRTHEDYLQHTACIKQDITHMYMYVYVCMSVGDLEAFVWQCIILGFRDPVSP